MEHQWSLCSCPIWACVSHCAVSAVYEKKRENLSICDPYRCTPPPLRIIVTRMPVDLRNVLCSRYEYGSYMSPALEASLVKDKPRWNPHFYWKGPNIYICLWTMFGPLFTFSFSTPVIHTFWYEKRGSFYPESKNHYESWDMYEIRKRINERNELQFFFDWTVIHAYSTLWNSDLKWDQGTE
jgi:hypothetical protein